MAALAACVAPADSGESMGEAGPTPTPGRMAAEDRSVQLELYSVWGGLLFNHWINAVEIYEESHPDVGVNVTFAPGHGDNPKLLTAVAGGIAPDMAMIVDFSTAQWVELGVMSDLTPYFDAAGLTGDDYWPAAWYLMNYKGKVWQMPFDVDPNFPIFWNIILPLTKPALATVALFQFMAAWGDYLGPRIYLSDKDKYTVSLGLALFRGEYNAEFGGLMAASTLTGIIKDNQGTRAGRPHPVLQGDKAWTMWKSN